MYTFHTAEHSRFSHSLGVYEIARRICDNFARNYATQEEGDGLWDDSNRLVVLCAALLHDIGHGPYSHTFEKIFDTNHEQITIDIILSEETEVNQILRKVSSTFPQEVASVIQKTHQITRYRRIDYRPQRARNPQHLRPCLHHQRRYGIGFRQAG